VAVAEPDPRTEAPRAPRGGVPPGAPSSPSARRIAVLVAHGMGQQVRYETIDAIVEALSRGAERALGKERAKATVRTTVRQAPVPAVPPLPHQGVTPRAEVRIGDRRIDVYEAYWAPITEGRVGLREVLSFLFSAGIDGARASWNGRRFERFLFGRWRSFRISPTTAARFGVALLAIGSLYLLGTMAMLVTAGTSSGLRLFGPVNPIRLVLLKRDIAIFGFAFLQVLAGIGVGLLIPRSPSRRTPGRVALSVSWLAAMIVFLGLALIVAAGVLSLIDLIPGLHLPPPPDPIQTLFDLQLRSIVGPALLAAIVAVMMRFSGHDRTLRVALGSSAVVAIELVCGIVFVAVTNATLRHGVLSGWVAGVAPSVATSCWMLAVLALWLGRRFLVEYAGDVTAYVSSHKVSRFDEIRRTIQDLVADVARRVYQAEDADGRMYDEIVWVGHSLGTVLAYDALNTLVNEDRVLATRMDVVERTSTFLTVASPLNKTAFIFRSQRLDPLDVREGLATTRQPMIVDYALRPRRWINLYADRDWIGGPLEYYDAPPLDGAPAEQVRLWRERHIRNRRDPWALTPLAAHTEIFAGERFARTLYAVVAG
jgi:hypothetical protein